MEITTDEVVVLAGTCCVQIQVVGQMLHTFRTRGRHFAVPVTGDILGVSPCTHPIQ